MGQFPISRYYYALACSKTSGVVWDWFRRSFCGNVDYDVLTQEAEKVPIGCRGVSMLPYFDGMISPQPNPRTRGMFANLKLQHTRADLYRAVLEALSFCLHENILFLKDLGFSVAVTRSIGGGAKNDFWLQMKADVTGMTVEKPMVTESAVLGSAMLSALGYGAFLSLAEASETWYQKQCVFSPDASRHQAYQEPYRRYQVLKQREGSAS